MNVKNTNFAFNSLLSPLINEIATYTEIDLPLLREKGIQLAFKREELLFPGISGNKYRKLKYNIQAAKAAKWFEKAPPKVSSVCCSLSVVLFQTTLPR